MTINYEEMFKDLIRRHNALAEQRNLIDVEISKLKQAILATAPLLPEEQQKLVQKEIEEMEEQGAGLVEGIKSVFAAHRDEWLTASVVRDYLLATRFDFRHYKTNPLASIATTLKRMVPAYLETKTFPESGINYKRRTTLLERMANDEVEDALQKMTSKKK